MRKIVNVALAMGFLWLVAYGEQKHESSTAGSQSAVLRVGATQVPAAEILEYIKPRLAEKGVQLQIQVFTDYVVPNASLAEGSSDVNLYQHKPFMDKTNEERGYHLTALAPIYVVPLGFYSQTLKSASEIPQGAVIAIPGDASNMARALILLHDNGVITLKDPSNLNASELDIVENPKKIVFKPMEAASLPSVLRDVSGAVINANYALQANMSLASALFAENGKSAYANVLVSREDNKTDERIAKLKDELLSKEVREFILSKYKGQVIPVGGEN